MQSILDRGCQRGSIGIGKWPKKPVGIGKLRPNLGGIDKAGKFLGIPRYRHRQIAKKRSRHRQMAKKGRRHRQMDPPLTPSYHIFCEPVFFKPLLKNGFREVWQVHEPVFFKRAGSAGSVNPSFSNERARRPAGPRTRFFQTAPFRVYTKKYR